MLEKLRVHPTQPQITLGFKTAVIALATLALFNQDLAILFSDALQSETASHFLAIPFLFIYLIYRKRKMLRAVIPLKSEDELKEARHIPLICGVILSATAVLLYWHGSYTFTPLEYHMFTLPIFVAGLTLILFNPQTLRQLAFPIAFLIFLVPPPSEILYTLGSTLSVISSEASNTIVNAFGIPSIITSEYGNPTIIVTRPDSSTIPFTVDIACSGIYGLIGFLIFAVFIAYIIRDKTWKKLAIILLGIPLIIALNVLRITIILTFGYNYGEAPALEIFHLTGGPILIFIGTILLLAISEKIFKMRIFKNVQMECSNCQQPLKTEDPSCLQCGRILRPPDIPMGKSDIAKIAVIALTVTLLFSIQTPVFALTSANPIILTTKPGGQQFSTGILPEIPNYTLAFYYRDTQFEQRAKQDMSLVYVYHPRNESLEPIFVAFEIASTRQSLHRWEACLITWPLSKGYQPRVNQIELKDIRLNENPPIIGRYFAFAYKDTNETQVVLYWYETAIFTINQTSQQKHMKISLIAYPDGFDNLQQIENQLTETAKAIVNYWQPIKTWSQISMIISQNGATMAAGSVVIMFSAIILYVFQVKKQMAANRIAYQKLSKENQQIIDAVKEAEKRGMSTLANIVDAYEKIKQTHFSKIQILERLNTLEEIGIIKHTIASRNDEPVQIWKAKI